MMLQRILRWTIGLPIAIIVVSPEVVTMPADQLATELHRLLSPLSRGTSDRT